MEKQEGKRIAQKVLEDTQHETGLSLKGMAETQEQIYDSYTMNGYDLFADETNEKRKG